MSFTFEIFFALAAAGCLFILERSQRLSDFAEYKHSPCIDSECEVPTRAKHCRKKIVFIREGFWQISTVLVEKIEKVRMKRVQ